MQRLQALFSPRFTTLLLGAAALALVVSIIAFPDEAFRSSLQGLQLWWKLVFPALLPFLIITELLRGMGVLHGLGVLLEPLLRLLFRLPGVAGWIVALGFTAGMPAGAAAVGQLRKDGTLTRDEGERLLAASHLLSPVFLVSVVGVGFLQNATAGLALAVIHYASTLLLAVLHRFRSAPGPYPLPKMKSQDKGGAGWLSRSFDAFQEARTRDGRTFGKLLGDSVTSSVQQLFLISGCMMMFSVLLHAVSLSGLVSTAASLASALGLNRDNAITLAQALLAGFFEPHLGAYALSQYTEAASSALPFALLSLLLSWGGLSTHAQVKSLTAASDLRYLRFLRSRLEHGGIAFVLTCLAWKPLTDSLGGEQPVLAHYAAVRSGWSFERDSLWPLVSPMMLQFGTMLLVLLVLSVFAAFLFHRRRHRR
ncbi:sporulation protein [Paenibacillus sp. MZ04-78.2]|uniref:nucleoside recognition domain-containing protein n=1 Tax=Paenibacillus sp. MZ04-78.2 TaxID=2962034 RepID=UPI0020B6418E|nr:nucleoside recognition domain-containing protein [Paenibacillus sp. MZ04-78.2]MCP3771738.1 sporulation protein [Paenibacillus sp. MZ04-78.2]